MNNPKFDRFEPMSPEDWETLDMSEHEKRVYYANKHHREPSDPSLHYRGCADMREDRHHLGED